MAQATPKDFTLKAGILHLKHLSRYRVEKGIVIKVKKNKRTEKLFKDEELIISSDIVEDKLEYPLPDWMLMADIEEVLLVPYEIRRIR